jgi:hypothetical protein
LAVVTVVVVGMMVGVEFAVARPADWKQQAGRWDRHHYVRVGVIVLAFALFAVALSR